MLSIIHRDLPGLNSSTIHLKYRFPARLLSQKTHTQSPHSTFERNPYLSIVSISYLTHCGSNDLLTNRSKVALYHNDLIRPVASLIPLLQWCPPVLALARTSRIRLGKSVDLPHPHCCTRTGGCYCSSHDLTTFTCYLPT